ncbi:STE20-like serine/threonine-protein kinase [Rhizoctonia solani]|uniref:STE20-like serine/threonine-protein kinase n=1 Tax=Rhizoctonia solani TaxID=456999 RepID=A0A0K6GF79_9AGAM|nr:STE20-like serine/threonine-protein kinase [Rhizoctonia solani]
MGKGLKYRLLARFVAAGALIKRVRGSHRGQSPEAHVVAAQPRVRNPITITSTMPVEDILAQFVRSGCKDLTRQLETCQLSQHPVSNGGFGDIYRGTLPNGQQVGLKCLRLQVGASEDDKRHLRRAAQELHVWSKCEHPHILQLLGVAKHQGRIAMVSPWMENGDLRWFLSQRPKVNRCALCIQISEAVVYLHESNIVHGDIKGANIVMAQDYIAKLTDFGSATIKASSLRLVGSSSTTNPAVSIRWAAPELVEGVTKCTPEGDIYALGMTFLEVITGSVPYAGFRDIAVLNKIINKIHPERPVELQAGVTGDGKKLLKHTAHEIYVWSKCRHANILPLIGVAQYNGRLAMISPWVEHNDLILFLSQQRSSQANRLRLCTQVADAVAYLHDVGIVHGDIKASSVLLSHDITVKLAGFGNMALRDYSLAFTPTAYGLGISVRWVAPEIIEGKTRLSSEADIYALGMTFLEIITGSVPYARLRDVAVLSKVTNKIHPNRPLDQLPIENEIASRVWSLLTDCWKYDAKDRPVAAIVYKKVGQATDAWVQARTSIDDGSSTGTPASTNCGGLSEMPIEQIMDNFASHGCHDITNQLNFPKPNETHTVGTCEEVYHATLLDGSEVQVRCLGLRISMLETNLKALRRAEKELSEWAKCQHPHILKLIGIAKYHGQVAIVSPWMENGDLARLLSHRGRVNRFAMVNQVVDAVAYLHEHNIVHGDIRASNILVSKDDTAMLTGFETVALEEQSLAFTTTTTSSTGVWAPVRWAAPEVLDGLISRSTESDIYSLGMTILVLI